MSRSFRNSNSRCFSNQQPKRKENYNSTQRVRFQENISEAETSQDEHGVKLNNSRDSHFQRKNNSRYQKDYIHNQDYSKLKSTDKLNISLESTTHQSSLKSRHNPSTSFVNTTDNAKSSHRTDMPNNFVICPFPSPSQKQNGIIAVQDQDDSKNVIQILDKLSKLNYQTEDYWTLKEAFFKHCGQNIRHIGKIPQASSPLGQELIKNGQFHKSWINVLKRQQGVDLRSLLQSYYVIFKQKVKRNAEKFEQVLKFLNEKKKQSQIKTVDEDQQLSDANMNLKRYRSLIDDQNQHNKHCQSSKRSSSSTTKFDIMLLYQQLKQQLRIQQMQQKITKNLQKTIQEWNRKTLQLQKQKASHFTPICDTDLMFQTQQSMIEKWSDFQQLQKRKQAIEQLEKQRVRERSPLSNRFRMMHECQTNSRRMQIEMACIFLNCESFYYLQDLEILNIQETIFSPTQQIVVLKAYTIEFDPKIGMMKLEPKIKTLISVYKFCGLPELIRLEKTYGKFNGIVVYPESFDIQKYLDNNKELSLTKDNFLNEVKSQLPSIQQKGKTAEKQRQKNEY